MSNLKRYTIFKIVKIFARCDTDFTLLLQVNSKYILKSTLTPKPTRKDMGTNLQKSRSCSSLDGRKTADNNTFNNYLTVHVSQNDTSKYDSYRMFNLFLGLSYFSRFQIITIEYQRLQRHKVWMT